MMRRILSILAILLAMPAMASVTGTIVDSDGKPIAGAAVSMYTPEAITARRLRLVSATPDRQPLATTTTDSKGNFAFESPKGTNVVHVAIEAKGYAPDAIRLLSDEDAGAIELTTAPMQRGTITANGKGLAGASVIVFGNQTEMLVKTDAEGHYSIPDPARWVNRLIVVHPDYAMVDDSVLPRQPLKLDRALSAGVALTGRVVGEDGKTGVAKAAVSVDDSPAILTADDGTFTIAHAPANWQDLSAMSGALTGARARGSNMTIRLTKSARVTGVVRDAKSQLPVANAEVRLGPEMMAMGFGRRGRRGAVGGGGALITDSVMTDAKGNFSITTEPGHYAISGFFPGSTIATSSISLTAGQTANKPMYSAALGRVTGMISDEDRRPVSGARISSESVRAAAGPFGGIAGPMSPTNSTYSAPDGRFALRGVITDADIQIAALKKGFPSARSATLKLVAGEKKTGINVTIPRGVAFTGRVLDGNGRAISGVKVEAMEARNQGRNMVVQRVVNMMLRANDDDLVRSGSDGTFTVRVKPGSYDVIFKREGFSTKVLHSTAVDAATKPVEVKLDPSVEVTGRVVRNGVGVEGVMVNAIAEDSSATTTTLADGSFALTDLNPGQMMVNVMKTDSFIQQIRQVSAPAKDVMIEIPNGGRITGRVVDKSSKNPVTAFQAGISFQRGAGGMMIALPPMLKDFTADDGTFTLENVPPGPTQIVVTAPGYTTARVPGLNVEDGKALDNVEVDLETGVRLSGRVTGPDGSPVSGVNVREVTNNGPMRLAGPIGNGGATTDANGQYSIDSIEPGDKTFTFSHQGFVSVDKQITLSGREAQLDAQMSSGMTISGTVVLDNGTPVPGASVNAQSASNTMFGAPSATTDPGGNFTMTGISPGHYTFMARKDGMGQGQLRDFDVTSGSPRIVIPAGGTIVGHITGLTDAEMQNATVFANSPTGNASATPDSTGAYRIDGAPTGTVHVSARTNRGIGPGGGKSSGTVSVQLDPGSTATADIQFKSSTVISGRVTRNGQPMTNVAVMFNSRGTGAAQSSGTTDGSGNYSISGLDDGPYAVAVLDIDRSNAFSSTYTVNGSGTYDIDIRTASLRGTVVDSGSGQGIPAAQVQLQSTGGGFMGIRAAQTDPSGAFFFDNVARGSYHVVVQADSYGHDTKDITIGDSAPDDLQFKLMSSAGITISVVDARDNRQITANAVRILDSSGQVVTAGGAFPGMGSPEPIKLSLSPGQYTVTIAAMGYASKVMTLSSPSSITVALTPGGTLMVRSRASTQVRGRLVDANGAIYRGVNIDPSPMTTTINNIAAGSYTLQVMDNTGAVINSVPVTIVDGQQAVIDI